MLYITCNLMFRETFRVSIKTDRVYNTDRGFLGYKTKVDRF